MLLLDIVIFSLIVALPAFITSLIALRLTKKSTTDSAVLLVFPLAVIGLVILVNILWHTLIYNKLYYEWDGLTFPFSLIHHEAPFLDGTGTWLAKGWTLQTLDLIWFGMVLGIYIIAAYISMLSNFSQNMKIALTSAGILSLISSLSFILMMLRVSN